MVKIAPFQGYKYDISNVKDFKQVVSPPYDVINPELQKKLHESSEYNIAHITKGKKFPDDDENNNEYTRAAKLLDSWIENGILAKEKIPCIYVLAQDLSR
jgi:uncharacterized protein (DUF1015 family)